MSAKAAKLAVALVIPFRTNQREAIALLWRAIGNELDVGNQYCSVSEIIPSTLLLHAWDPPCDRSRMAQGYFSPDLVVWRSMIGFSPFSL